MKTDRQLRLFSVVFFLSGATSLVYQVAWMRKLSLFFGSDVYSAAVTLGAFMSGLCIGSWLAGLLARRLSHPLIAYGLLEILVAAYAFVFAAIVGLFDGILSDLYRTSYVDWPALYQATRALIAFGVLIPPTAMMGATLPLVAQHFAVADRVLGARLGHFYAVNTVGALVGTLVGGFLMLPWLGVALTVGISAAINLLIGLLIALLSATGYFAMEAPSSWDRPVPAIRIRAERRLLVPLALGISGFAALALEVVLMRIMIQSFSATVYAFSIILACFLLGISLGSNREARVVDSRPRPVRSLIQFELALFAYVASLGVLTYAVPGLFGTLLWGSTAITGGAFAATSTLTQIVVAGLLIIAPARWLGAAFPLAVKAYTQNIRDRANNTGVIYAANTLGALTGALTAGFILIPMLGARNSLLVIALVFLVAALALLPLSETGAQDRLMLRLKVAAGVLGIIVTLALPRQVVVNFNMQQSTRPEVVYHGEGVSHTIDIVKTRTGNTLMMVNGNVEADTTLLQRRHFILKAHLPLLLHSDPKDVAVIGLGLGITLAAVARNPAVERIKLIELSPEMVEAHRHLRTLTGDVLANPKIQLLIDDGRNFLNRGLETYDMITADPIHPRISGVGFLYSREYYEKVKTRLRPGGYVLQWMPMYAISRASFDVAFRTFADVFPNASFWYVRSHGLFVSAMAPTKLDFLSLAKRFQHPAVLHDMESIGIHSPHGLLAHLLMDDKQVRRYLDSGTGAINTDDNSRLEYQTPGEFLEQTRTIIEALLPYVGWNFDMLVGATPADHQQIRQLSVMRRRSLIEELKSPIE